MPNATTIWEIYTSKLDNLFLTGFNVGSLDMNFSPSTNNISTGGFISKYNNCSSAPTLPGAIAGLSTMCAGSGATSYSIATVSSATSYSWNLPGGWNSTSATNTISATPGTSGVFSVTANNACGASPQQTLAITVNHLPTVSINSGSICIGQSFTLSPRGAATYTIQGGNAVVSPTSSSTYSVIGTSAAGCISSSPANSSVTVNPLPAINASTSNTLICAGQTATLTASGAFTYTWNQGGAGTSIAVSPSLTTTYTISGTSSAGCNNVSTITQSVSACTSINETVFNVNTKLYPNPAHSSFFIEQKVIDLIKSAQSKLYIHNQTFNAPKDGHEKLKELIDEVIDRQNAGVDVKIIFRNFIASVAREKLTALKEAGLDVNCVKVHPKCHTKGILVDGKTVLLGSQNMSNDGISVNRDASLLFEDKPLAEYFEKIFMHDWAHAKQDIGSESLGVELLEPGQPTPKNKIRISWSEVLETL